MCVILCVWFLKYKQSRALVLGYRFLNLFKDLLDFFEKFKSLLDNTKCSYLVFSFWQDSEACDRLTSLCHPLARTTIVVGPCMLQAYGPAECLVGYMSR